MQNAHSAYIEDNFPLTDRFKACDVERVQSNPDAPEDEEEEEEEEENAVHKISAHKDWEVEAAKSSGDPAPRGAGLKEKFRNLRSKVEEKAANSSQGDLIAMAGILVVIILATLALAALKGRKKADGKKS